MAILDQYGNPVYSTPTFAAAAVNDGSARKREVVRKKSINELIPASDHATLVYVSGRLYYNMPVVKAAIDQRAMYSVGRAFAPKFLGADKEWGDIATQWLVEKWFPTCDVRGPNHDWSTGLYLDSVHIDRDGDIGCLYTESENGWPMLQRIPAYRIGMRDNLRSTGIVPDGPYKGLKIVKGVVLNKRERPVAYHVLGEPTDGSEDRYVSARDMDFIYDANAHDAVRGLPCFTASLNTFRDILQSTEWEMQALLIAGMIALVEHNDDGLAGVNDPLAQIKGGGRLQSPTNKETEFADVQGGLIKYVRAGTGAKIEQLGQNRPGAEWDTFMDRGIRSALAEMGWSMSLVWKPTGQGTAERIELAKAERAVKDRQDILTSTARRRVSWALAKAVKIGELPPYPGTDIGGAMKWGFTYPPRMSIDFGREWNARLEMWRAGFVNATEIVAEAGNTYEAVIEERALEVAMRKLVARRVSAEMGVEITDQDMSMQSTADTTVAAASSQATAQAEADGNDNDADNPDNDMQDFETLKAKFDAYGVAVRAGAITPIMSDEQAFRAEAGFPVMDDNVQRAWQEDKGFRRPITLLQKAQQALGMTPSDTDSDQ